MEAFVSTLTTFLKLAMLAGVAAPLTLTVSRSQLFSPVREWVKKHSKFLGELLTCPYCLSHWVSALIVVAYRPYREIHSGWVVGDFLVSMFIIITLSAPLMRWLFTSIGEIE